MPPIRTMLSASGISEQQWRVLRVLDEHGPQDTTTLAARACLLLPSLTRIAQKMRGNGLIEITRDELDRRRQTISITDAGQDIVDSNRKEVARIVSGFKKTLGEDNYELLLDLLASLNPDAL